VRAGGQSSCRRPAGLDSSWRLVETELEAWRNSRLQVEGQGSVGFQVRAPPGTVTCGPGASQVAGGRRGWIQVGDWQRLSWRLGGTPDYKLRAGGQSDFKLGGSQARAGRRPVKLQGAVRPVSSWLRSLFQVGGAGPGQATLLQSFLQSPAPRRPDSSFRPVSHMRAAGRFQVCWQPGTLGSLAVFKLALSQSLAPLTAVASSLSSLTPSVTVCKVAARRALAGRRPVSSLPPGGRLRAGGRFQVGAESVASPLSLTPLVIIFEFAATRAIAGRWPVSCLLPAGHARAAGAFTGKLALSQSLAPLTAVASSLSLPHSLSHCFQLGRQAGACWPRVGFKLALSRWLRLSLSLPWSLFSSLPPGGRLLAAGRFQSGAESVALPLSLTPLVTVFKFAARRALAGRRPVSSWRSVSGVASLSHSLSHYFRVCSQAGACGPLAGFMFAASRARGARRGRFQVGAQSVAGATDGCGFQSLSPSLRVPQSLFSSWQPGGRLPAAGRFQSGAESVASPLSLTPLVIIFKFAARRALAGRWPVSIWR